MRERNISLWVASHTVPGLACNPGMCPDRELNQPAFGVQEDAQLTEPHKSGHASFFS